MPEYREVWAHLQLLLYLLWIAFKSGSDLTVLGLWADSTKEEAKKSKKGSRSHQGLVYQLDSSCSFLRGTHKHQTPLYPPQLRKNRSNPNPPSISEANLRLSSPNSITATNRALILNFETLHLSLAFLTHTSVQLYTREVWENSICKVNKATRRFQIGLAIEFKDYILAFISLDFLFQPRWVESLDDLPIPHPDVFTDFSAFLVAVCRWMTLHFESRSARTGLIVDVLQGTLEFHGVGAYTAVELCFLAGISPFLTEAEVFDVPLRAARICDAYYEFASRSCSDSLCLVDEYKSFFQAVSSKPATTFFQDAAQLYDPFEPNFLSSALNREHCNLGHLIFGSEEWNQLQNERASIPQDPMTRLFAERGRLQCFKTYLKPSFYMALFTNDKIPRFHPTYLYIVKRKVWSIVPRFPSNFLVSAATSLFSDDEQLPNDSFTVLAPSPTGDDPAEDAAPPENAVYADIGLVEGLEHHSHLYDTIVLKRSTDVAIRPLEYCGNGIIERFQGKEVVAACRADPALPGILISHQHRGLKCRTSGIEKTGKSKNAMTEGVKRRLDAESHQNQRDDVSALRSDFFLKPMRTWKKRI
ncbi:hypothetical protein C8J56DRAFT_1170696 [Mycena floridula]|nr:hypothetical protein C8J56DRAFT_1170696 [Mycena floridula]